jgi:hypothetical protein
MGGWYHVIKTIRGVPYRYKQTSWREGRRIRTKCRCLGRADGFTGGQTGRRMTKKRAGAKSAGAPESFVSCICGRPVVVDTSLCRECTHSASETGVGNARIDVLIAERKGAVGNTTDEPWRQAAIDGLVHASNAVATREQKEAVLWIIERVKFGEPDGAIERMEKLVGLLPIESAAAQRQLRDVIKQLRNTTGTHTDESLIEMLFTAKTVVEWEQPWRDGGIELGTTPVTVDLRVLAAPLALGVTVKSQPFGNTLAGIEQDGAWYSRIDDTIQIPDACRYKTTTDGVTAAELFEHTLLHETCHAAGRHSRLNRNWSQCLTGRYGRASHEVVTETAACLVERKLGLKRGGTWKRSTRYVQAWALRAGLSERDDKELREDALQVADYVMKRIETVGNRCAGCGQAVDEGIYKCGDCIPF